MGRRVWTVGPTEQGHPRWGAYLAEKLGMRGLGGAPEQFRLAGWRGQAISEV